ncbi:hypothetical protein KIPB_002356 [Kipferlia bialata]|uniref:Uncharacterized protein n=1 Tax=Kipferlia bialata TaxID=797122 RepID=A0A9K3GFX6_9EUKA|nr:hypothetical protein KIPB_002356 [Kipferlia bialata]|eukprot:g2356.t1
MRAAVLVLAVIVAVCVSETVRVPLFAFSGAELGAESVSDFVASEGQRYLLLDGVSHERIMLRSFSAGILSEGAPFHAVSSYEAEAGASLSETLSLSVTDVEDTEEASAMGMGEGLTVVRFSHPVVGTEAAEARMQYVRSLVSSGATVYYTCDTTRDTVPVPSERVLTEEPPPPFPSLSLRFNRYNGSWLDVVLTEEKGDEVHMDDEDDYGNMLLQGDW